LPSRSTPGLRHFCLAGLAIADMIVCRLAFRQKALFWRGLAVYLVLLVPYFALNLSLAHSLFPQTYVAKVGRTSLFAALASGNTAQVRAPAIQMRRSYTSAGLVAHLWRAEPGACAPGALRHRHRPQSSLPGAGAAC